MCAAIPLMVSGVLACSGTDATGVPGIVTANPYTQVQLNVRSAVLSTVPPYDTLQLTPTAYDANGNVIPLPGPITYTVNDTTLHVNANGLLTLTHQSGPSAMVIVAVQDTVHRLTHADTAFIRGTTTVPSSPLSNFSIHPAGTDSTVLDLGNGTKTLNVTALDATGAVIPSSSLSVHFYSADPTIAMIDARTGVVTSETPGTVRLTASTTYYGVTKTDSVDFRIGYSDTLTIQTIATTLPDGTYRYHWSVNHVVTGVGKAVIFAIPDLFVNPTSNLLVAGASLPVGDRQINEGVHVMFDDSSAAQASSLPATWLAAQFASTDNGNIDIQIPDSVVVVDSILLPTSEWIWPYSSVKFTNYCSSAPYPCATARSFSIPGTYNFTSTTTGASGTITVVAP